MREARCEFRVAGIRQQFQVLGSVFWVGNFAILYLPSSIAAAALMVPGHSMRISDCGGGKFKVSGFKFKVAPTEPGIDHRLKAGLQTRRSKVAALKTFAYFTVLARKLRRRRCLPEN